MRTPKIKVVVEIILKILEFFNPEYLKIWIWLLLKRFMKKICVVNKKMKGLNNIFYDILLKLSEKQSNFKLNKMLINKYFEKIRDNNKKQHQFELYLNNFYNFCFELSSDNMIQDVQKYKF